MSTVRMATPARRFQGSGESLIYTVTTTNWGSSPGTVSVKAYSVSSDETLTDVTSTVIPAGSASVTGDVITLPAIKNLTAGTLYLIEVTFTSGSNIFVAAFELLGER